MSKKVHIKAAEGSNYLEFSHPTPSDTADCIEYFSVTLKVETLEAAARVWAYTDARWLVTIFKQMEDNWRGWEGVKEWKTVEEEFSIQFASDKKGHILVEVYLRPDYIVGGHWEVKGGFYLEAGQLPTMTRQITEFFSV
ncbi:MAG: hypothetical protein HY866_05910 [Chloroflexi bacterium]|nr:hypothetical protein [Chloroflexota bacterium]